MHSIVFAFLFLLSGTILAQFNIQNSENFRFHPNEKFIAESITIDGILTGNIGVDIRINNNWNNNNSFIHNGSKVTFIGNSQSIITGTNTFNMIVADTSENDTLAKTLIFAANTTQFIENIAVFQGNSNNLINLFSTHNGIQANLDFSTYNGSAAADFVNVKDNNAIITNIINPTHSIDSGNNINWFIVDNDADGISDASENKFGTDINSAEYYGDSIDINNNLVSDNLENYIKNKIFTNENYISNAQIDSDSDGLPDALEVIKGLAPQNVNVPTVNGESDDNHNHITNAVELYLLGLNTKTYNVEIITPINHYNDSDGDGLPDVLEIKFGSNPQDKNHPIVYSENNPDGVSNVIKYYLNTLGITPTSAISDIDKDLIPDAVEVVIGSHPLVAHSLDADSDGLSDYMELYLADDITSTITFATTTNGDLPDYLAVGFGTAFTKTAITTVAQWLNSRDNADIYSTTIRSNNISTEDDDNDSISNIKELQNGKNPFIKESVNTTYYLQMYKNNQTVGILDNSDADQIVIKAHKTGSQGSNAVFDWDMTSPTIKGKNNILFYANNITGSNTNKVDFDVEGINIGYYAAKLRVTINNISYFYIIPVIVDEDFISDVDNDGIPDTIDDNYYFGLQTKKDYVIKTTNPSAIIRAGDTARKNKTTSVIVNNTQLANNNFAADIKEHIGGTIDLEVVSLNAGASIGIIVPLSEPIPVNAVYRKMDKNGIWQDFMATSGDGARSALGVAGNCDNITHWGELGVATQGHNCVKITITDGGEWDMDNQVNGTIIDPFGIMSNTADDGIGVGQGGGCSIASGSFDPIFYIMLFIALFTMRFRQINLQLVSNN